MKSIKYLCVSIYCCEISEGKACDVQCFSNILVQLIRDLFDTNINWLQQLQSNLE